MPSWRAQRPRRLGSRRVASSSSSVPPPEWARPTPCWRPRASSTRMASTWSWGSWRRMAAPRRRPWWKDWKCSPPRLVEYRGTTLKEFDLDGALARRPAVILVDELAHTNAEGSRHRKRWQDVLELLDAGITVYTTLNVQHVESLNDVVAKITGVVVRETVPDSVLERADEIELVDLAPDDLLERLQEGKVYVPAQAEEAIHNFFRKGNLIALRELALRQTAERVDAQMQAYRRDHAIGKTWPVTERILVCVSPSPFSPQLVRAGHRLAHRLRRGVDRGLRGDARARTAAADGPGPRRPDSPPRRVARRRDGHPERFDHERRDPGLRARAERQQDRDRQAHPIALEAHRARLHRGRAGPGQRGDRHPGRQRRGRSGPGASPARVQPACSGLGFLRAGRRGGRGVHWHRLG